MARAGRRRGPDTIGVMPDREPMPFRRGQRPADVTAWQLRTPAFRRLFHDVYVDRARRADAAAARAGGAARGPGRDGLAPQRGAAVGRHRARRRFRAPDLPGASSPGRGHHARTAAVHGRAVDPVARRPGHDADPDLPRPRRRRSASSISSCSVTPWCDGRRVTPELLVEAATAHRGPGSPPGARAARLVRAERRLGHGDPAADAHRPRRPAGTGRRPPDPLARRPGALPLRPQLPRRGSRHRVRRLAARRLAGRSGARTSVAASGSTGTTGASSWSSPRTSTARRRRRCTASAPPCATAA